MKEDSQTPAEGTVTAPASIVDRALRIVGDVRAGEGKTALALASTLFMLLSAYYLLKVARETLVLSSYDAEVKAYIAAVQAVVLIPAVWLYGRLSDRVDRFRLVTGVTIFFAANLGIFAALHAIGVPIAIPFFVWVGIFNVFVIAQLWAFANDVYDEARGRRLFAVIGLGSSLGAIAGSYGAEPIGDAIGTLGLLLVPIGMLLSTVLGVWWVHRHPFARREAPKKETRSRKGGFALLISDRWLVLIAVMVLLLNCENTIGEYVLDRVMQDDIRAEVASATGAVDDAVVEARVREFKSYYFGAFNTLGFLLQLLVAGRLMKRGGAGLAVLVLPVIALLAHAGIIVSGAALMVVAGAKVAENSVDYSIQNTGKNALFLVMPAEAKYKVKVLIDSVIVRFGDVIAGVLVIVAAGVLDLGPVFFAVVAAAISALWIAIAVFVRREYDRRAKEQASASGAEQPEKPEKPTSDKVERAA